MDENKQMSTGENTIIKPFGREYGDTRIILSKKLGYLNNKLDYFPAEDTRKRYISSFNCRPCGKPQHWIKVYHEAVREFPQLQVLLAIGFVPPLLPLLSQKSNIYNIFVSLFGDEVDHKADYYGNGANYHGIRKAIMYFLASIYGNPSTNNGKGKLVKWHGLVEEFDTRYDVVKHNLMERQGFLKCVYRDVSRLKKNNAHLPWIKKLFSWAEQDSVDTDSAPMNVFIVNACHKTFAEVIPEKISDARLGFLEYTKSIKISHSVGNALLRTACNHYGLFIDRYIAEISVMYNRRENSESEGTDELSHTGNTLEVEYKKCMEAIRDCEQKKIEGKREFFEKDNHCDGTIFRRLDQGIRVGALILLASRIANNSIKKALQAKDASTSSLADIFDEDVLLEQIYDICSASQQKRFIADEVLARIESIIKANKKYIVNRAATMDERNPADMKNCIGIMENVKDDQDCIRYFIKTGVIKKWVAAILAMGNQKNEIRASIVRDAIISMHNVSKQNGDKTGLINSYGDGTVKRSEIYYQDKGKKKRLRFKGLAIVFENTYNEY